MVGDWTLEEREVLERVEGDFLLILVRLLVVVVAVVADGGGVLVVFWGEGEAGDVGFETFVEEDFEDFDADVEEDFDADVGDVIAVVAAESDLGV